jgi:hypothetical protein
VQDPLRLIELGAVREPHARVVEPDLLDLDPDVPRKGARLAGATLAEALPDGQLPGGHRLERIGMQRRASHGRAASSSRTAPWQVDPSAC